MSRAAALQAATRLGPDNAWVRFALASIAQSTGKTPALMTGLFWDLGEQAATLPRRAA